MPKVVIRRFREGEEEKTIQFLKTVFGGWFSLRQWKWKFRDVEKVQGRKSIIWVMEVENKIVGHLAAIPMKLRVGSEVFPACQLVDGASSPDYRHKGLYKNLFDGLLNDAVEEGFAVTLGFPNKFFHRVCERQGSFETICQIKKMFKVISARNALNTLRVQSLSENSEDTGENSLLRELLVSPKRKTFSILLDLTRKILTSMVASAFSSQNTQDKIQLQEIDPKTLGAEAEVVWAKSSRNYKFACERDQRFLNWRYSKPGAEYRAFVVRKGNAHCAYVVIGLEQKSLTIGKLRLWGLKAGYIVDLVAEKDLISPLISTAEKELSKEGACFVECWTTDEESPSFKALRARRYSRLPNEMYKVYFVAKVDEPKLKASISAEYSSEILLSLGDSDIV